MTAESRIDPPAADSRQIEVITSSSIAVQLFMISASLDRARAVSRTRLSTKGAVR
jgi:hypothetical protein